VYRLLLRGDPIEGIGRRVVGLPIGLLQQKLA
jgi:hypothetical protein